MQPVHSIAEAKAVMRQIDFRLPSVMDLQFRTYLFHGGLSYWLLDDAEATWHHSLGMILRSLHRDLRFRSDTRRPEGS